MDIAFHYFAVNTLALAAGFNSYDAQIIASYSQFIDEYNLYYDFYDEDGKTQHPVATGFMSKKNYVNIVFKEDMQRLIVSPFHFIPCRPGKSNKDERTQAATIGDDSLISHLLQKAKHELITDSYEDKSVALMHIGMLLHTFADTHAHQKFSGFRSSVNEAYNVEGYDNNNGKRVSIGPYCHIAPAIGHAKADRMPDLTHVNFKLEFQESVNSSETEKDYARNNTETFIEVSKQILNYLRSCRNEPDVGDGVWKELSKKLRQAFLCKLPKDPEKDLPNIWVEAFPAYDYFYSNTLMWRGFFFGKIPKHAMYDPEKTLEENDAIGKQQKDKYTCTEDYHHYNRFADELLDALYKG